MSIVYLMEEILIYMIIPVCILLLATVDRFYISYIIYVYAIANLIFVLYLFFLHILARISYSVGDISSSQKLLIRSINIYLNIYKHLGITNLFPACIIKYIYLSYLVQIMLCSKIAHWSALDQHYHLLLDAFNMQSKLIIKSGLDLPIREEIREKRKEMIKEYVNAAKASKLRNRSMECIFIYATIKKASVCTQQEDHTGN